MLDDMNRKAIFSKVRQNDLKRIYVKHNRKGPQGLLDDVKNKI